MTNSHSPSPGRRAAVLGRPIGHSLSPVLHTAAYREFGLDWRYDAIDCGVAELPAQLSKGLSGWAGFSVTMPLKHAALAVADVVDPVAELVAAANTLLPIEVDGATTGWRATNTDVDGIVGALRDAGPEAPSPGAQRVPANLSTHNLPAHDLLTVGGGFTATLLGAGGTAQAAVVALARLGVDRVTVLVRDPARASALLATAERVGVAVTIGLLEAEATGLDADLVISTLPAHAADAASERAWRPAQTLLDVAYHPWPSHVALRVGQAGGRVVSGASMLLHQAAAQVELMTGRPAPFATMRAALLAASPGCGA